MGWDCYLWYRGDNIGQWQTYCDTVIYEICIRNDNIWWQWVYREVDDDT